MSQIKDILEYSKSLEGIKYTWWTKGSTNEAPHPFYIEKIPTKAYLKKHGINCAGFINLLRQKAGKKVPGSGINRGGTDGWFNYLKKKQVLEKFDDIKNYPLGTLFLRKYRNVEDQGHVAVYLTKGKNPNRPLYGEIIHSHAAEPDPKDCGVDITAFGWSHFWNRDTSPNGYYEYAVLPKDWLFSD